MANIKDLKELVHVLSIAITREQRLAGHYLNAYHKITDENAKRFLLLLVEEERAHEAKLRAQLNQARSELEFKRLEVKKKPS